MYLKNWQISQIRDGIENLKELATLKNCSLPYVNDEEFRLWATWIDDFACQIESTFSEAVDKRYLKYAQVLQIKDGIERLKTLSTLKNCALPYAGNRDMKCWALWINCYACKIQDSLDNHYWD